MGGGSQDTETGNPPGWPWSSTSAEYKGGGSPTFVKVNIPELASRHDDDIA